MVHEAASASTASSFPEHCDFCPKFNEGVRCPNLDEAHYAPGRHDAFSDALGSQCKLEVVEAQVAEGLQAEVFGILDAQRVLGGYRSKPWYWPILQDF